MLKKLKTELPYDQALLLLGIYPKKTIKEKWIKKIWYIYTMEYYSAIKRKRFKSVIMR